MKDIELDFEDLPENIGKRKGNRRDYKVHDKPFVRHWIAEQLRLKGDNLSVTVSGKIPGWMWAIVTVELYENESVDEMLYTTQQMADSVLVFPEVR